MRGRTNITQRTGPSVIGNLVTQKQVTGDKIEVGDFVEFTGDTTQEQTLFSDVNFDYYSKFKISSSIFGVALYNSLSNVLRIVIYNKDGIIKDVNFSSIGLNLSGSGYDRFIWSGTIFNASYDNGKLYVTSGEISRDGKYSSESDNFIEDLKNKNFIIAFNISQDYNVTLDRYYSLSLLYNYISSNSISGFEGTISNVVAPIVKNNKVYVFLGRRPSSDVASNVFLFYYNLSDSDVKNIKYQDFGSFYFNKRDLSTGSGLTYYSNQFSYKVLDEEIVVGYGQTIKIFNVTTNNYNVYTSEYLFANIGFDICKVGNLYFIRGSAIFRDTSSTPYKNLVYVGCVVFYLDDSGINVVGYFRNTFTSSTSNNYGYYVYRCLIYVKQKNVNEYYIISTYTNDENTRSVSCDIFDYEQNKITSNNSITLGSFMVGWIFEDESIIVSRIGYNTISLYNKLYNLANDKIVNIESFDLVKKYSSRIDGVAKTEGSAGQQISVYIP